MHQNYAIKEGDHACLGESGEWYSSRAKQYRKKLQVDLETPVEVCAIATQGDIDGDEWVKAFKLSYSYNGRNLKTYEDANGTEVVR